MNVLIVEPDTVLARQYQNVFKAGGVQAFIAHDAQSAVAAVDKNKPDLVILELQLAGHSGIEFLHEFRSYEDWANIPVVIYSSVPEYILGVDKKVWQQFGVKRYFYKPKTSLQQLLGVAKTINDA